MNEILYMVLTFMAGIVMGILFFYGLWITVKKAVHAKIPALWFFGSSLFRIAIILAGFYYISQGNWQKLFVCLIGFITGRFIIKRYTNRIKENELQLKREKNYES